MNTQKDLSYFKIRLQEHLNNSFPELVTDKVFIADRALLAAQTYESAFLSGNDIYQCNNIAEIVLFESLYFSKFDSVFEVICNEFAHLMPEEQLRPFALKMLPLCLPLFEKYALTDDFAYTYDYDSLYTEITGAIQLWIEDHHGF